MIRSSDIKGIDKTSFRKDLAESELVKSPPKDVEQLTILYNSTLSFPLDIYALETVKYVPDRPASARYNTTIRDDMRARRHAERRWRKSGLKVHRQSRNHCTQAVIIRRAKTDHIQYVLDAAGTDSGRCFQ